MGDENLKTKSRGQWEYIFSVLAPELAAAMEAAEGSGTPGHVECPVHGGKDGDGYRLYQDWKVTGGSVCNTCGPKATGIRTIAWLRGWDFKQAAREIYKALDGDDVKTFAPRVVAPPPEVNYAANAKRIERLLANAVHFKGTPAELYLRNRGIPVTGKERLGFVANLGYWAKGKNGMEKLGESPAMIAKILSPEGKVLAVHRTYITADGRKAAFPEVKKLTSATGPMQGGTIRLYEAKPGDILGLTEGIETACAVHAAFGIPVWACVSSTLLAGAAPAVPDGVRVVVFADLDQPQKQFEGLGGGQHAAVQVARALRDAGKEVRILMPHGPIPEGRKGVDWLDVWQENPVGMSRIKL